KVRGGEARARSGAPIWQNEAKSTNDFSSYALFCDEGATQFAEPLLDALCCIWSAQAGGPRRMMCRAIAFCLAVAAFMPLEYALAGDTDDSLRLYAVNIVQDPPQPWTGYGIYLGRGLVITAAHV